MAVIRGCVANEKSKFISSAHCVHTIKYILGVLSRRFDVD